MEIKIGDRELEYVIETFNVNVDGIEEVISKNDMTLYYVKNYTLNSCETYIVDSYEAISLACKPYVVGSDFLKLNEKLAMKIVDLIETIVHLKEWEGRIVFQHVLRAGPGYVLHKALTNSGYDLSEVYLRPRYIEPSFRNHLAVRRLEVIYTDFSSLPKGESVLLLKPDTEATGRTSVTSLRELIKVCRSIDTKVEELVLYGFMTLSALRRITKEISKLGIRRVYAIALVDIASLAYNEYDMVLYGIDESYYTAGLGTKFLGAITSEKILRKCLPYYVPGMDQPGDWSARQDLLLTGIEYEPGDVRVHLKNSKRIAKRLLEIHTKENVLEDWQKKAIINCIRMLDCKLNELY
ncbi:MAG: hypothetical protein DRJ49_00115 [Thermoprotei archaeon]|nr:MAG: hypothetical protein DRJ49_00115 [Thermoprotei archaeon]